jgi:hypothetical protein
MAYSAVLEMFEDCTMRPEGGGLDS